MALLSVRAGRGRVRIQPCRGGGRGTRQVRLTLDSLRVSSAEGEGLTQPLPSPGHPTPTPTGKLTMRVHTLHSHRAHHTRGEHTTHMHTQVNAHEVRGSSHSHGQAHTLSAHTAPTSLPSRSRRQIGARQHADGCARGPGGRGGGRPRPGGVHGAAGSGQSLTSSPF